uniref:Uncharacterized protein n=1 Tax=Eutreptiella gymnastica TaxID=73025 RepID=A0A7S1J5C8_9EUGL|mmetsp:Transcript_68801/g.121526  ORF Transcript_68801/g.121526 Transcript_68801/m.121526 type:complete len:167 (+) Transcript_68801:642-1142(+)
MVCDDEPWAHAQAFVDLVQTAALMDDNELVVVEVKSEQKLGTVPADGTQTGQKAVEDVESRVEMAQGAESVIVDDDEFKIEKVTEEGVGVAAERPQETVVAKFEAIVATSSTHATRDRPNYEEKLRPTLFPGAMPATPTWIRWPGLVWGEEELTAATRSSTRSVCM